MGVTSIANLHVHTAQEFEATDAATVAQQYKQKQQRKSSNIRAAAAVVVDIRRQENSRIEKRVDLCYNKSRYTIAVRSKYYEKLKHTTAVRSKISSKLIFASCV